MVGAKSVWFGRSSLSFRTFHVGTYHGLSAILSNHTERFPSPSSPILLFLTHHLDEQPAVDIMFSKCGFTFPYSESSLSGSHHVLRLHAT